jgi:hypothetical protein
MNMFKKTYAIVLLLTISLQSQAMFPRFVSRLALHKSALTPRNLKPAIKSVLTKPMKAKLVTLGVAGAVMAAAQSKPRKSDELIGWPFSEYAQLIDIETARKEPLEEQLVDPATLTGNEEVDFQIKARLSFTCPQSNDKCRNAQKLANDNNAFCKCSNEELGILTGWRKRSELCKNLYKDVFGHELADNDKMPYFTQKMATPVGAYLPYVFHLADSYCEKEFSSHAMTTDPDIKLNYETGKVEVATPVAPRGIFGMAYSYWRPTIEVEYQEKGTLKPNRNQLMQLARLQHASKEYRKCIQGLPQSAEQSPCKELIKEFSYPHDLVQSAAFGNAQVKDLDIQLRFRKGMQE